MGTQIANHAAYMPNADDFYELVSGRKRGIVAAFVRGLFAVGEIPYSAAVWWRNRGYDRGSREIHTVEVPVVSVGNLTVGGTGKTPMVKWIARYLRKRDLRVSIVSRGYGAENAGANDEALELELALPDVPHVQNPDRVAAAKLAIDELATQLVLLDDGFQHRRLGRDLDIVLIDATQPFGYDHLLPRGTLRESLAGLKRADLVCLTRADAVTDLTREEIRRRVLRYNPELLWCEASHVATTLVNSSGSERPLAELVGQRVVAFSGIGNPAAFARTVASTGAEVAATKKFADHHSYGRNDIDELASLAMSCEADWLVCTQKDLVKIGVDTLLGRALWAIAIEMEVSVGRELLEARLGECVKQTNGDA